MKPNLKTFPKAAFPVSQMTSAELLDHILKLVNWKSRFEEELQQLDKNIPAGERHLRFTQGIIHMIHKVLGENPT